MTYPKFTLPIALGVLLAMPTLAASLDDTITSCNDCHGAGGVSAHDDMPSIAAVSAPVHEDAMFAYLDDARPCMSTKYRGGNLDRPATDMCQIAKALSEDDIIEIAAHFSSLPFTPMAQAFDAAKASAGEAIHDSECSRCHTDGGGNAQDDAGILAGQPMGYLRASIAEFRNGEREQPKKMKPKMDALSDADAEALVHFYASQQ